MFCVFCILYICNSIHVNPLLQVNLNICYYRWSRNYLRNSFKLNKLRVYTEMKTVAFSTCNVAINDCKIIAQLVSNELVDTSR